MGRIHEQLTKENADLLDLVRRHEFFAQVSSGTIAGNRLHPFLSQAYRFARSYGRTLAHLAVRAPHDLRTPILEEVGEVFESCERFEELVAGSDVDVRNARVSFPQHAYLTFAASTIRVRTFEESMVALYAMDSAFFSTWSLLRGLEAEGDLRLEALHVLGDERFTQRIARLGKWIDRLWETATPATREKMREIFPVPVHLLLSCLDELLAGTDGWPGGKEGVFVSSQRGTGGSEATR